MDLCWLQRDVERLHMQQEIVAEYLKQVPDVHVVLNHYFQEWGRDIDRSPLLPDVGS